MSYYDEMLNCTICQFLFYNINRTPGKKKQKHFSGAI